MNDVCYLSLCTSQRGSCGSSYSETPESIGEPLEERREGRTSIPPECIEELESTDTCTEILKTYSPHNAAIKMHIWRLWCCALMGVCELLAQGGIYRHWCREMHWYYTTNISNSRKTDHNQNGNDMNQHSIKNELNKLVEGNEKISLTFETCTIPWV